MNNLLIGLLLTCSFILGQTEQENQDLAIPDQQLIGVLSASYLYQSYMNIGYLADATEGSVYSNEEALEQCEALLGVIGGVRDEMLAYSRQIESSSDKLYVENLVRVADLLLQEATALLRYYESDDEEYARKYMEFNDMAQKAISQLLGIDTTE